MIKCSFLKSKTIISWDIRLFKVKLLILPKMTIVEKGDFVSFLKITMSLAGKGYLKEIRKSLSLGLFNIARQRYQDKGLAQYDTVKSSCSRARNEVIEELQPVYIGNEIVGWVKLTVPGI